ncbi:hypothetical protein [Streptacidiphilus rugosus]|uniref:hypothetical protein n=1 Tax=Streptacidiphilus rugosus TaxID=405783 RepID=UPI0018DD7874|nr:hypothetical protein [Streptacidiphilus rugosus]
MIQTINAPARVLGAALLSRRQFNLSRWTRGQEFIDLHASAVSWLDENLNILECESPWLHRFGVDTWDYCHGAVRSMFHFSVAAPRHVPSVGCTRNVIAVYGFDGDPGERLEKIAETMSAAGWKRIAPLPMRPWEGDNGYAMLEWQPIPVAGPRPAEDVVAPWGGRNSSPYIALSWCSRGEQTPLDQDPSRMHINTRNYLALESSGTEYWKIPDAVLEGHEHVLAVNINLGYYSSLDSMRSQRRIPRHLLPTKPKPWGSTQ